MNTYSSPPSPSSTHFLKGKMKYPKNWVGRAIFKKICRENQKAEDRENVKAIGRLNFFIFIFSYDGN